MTDHQYPKGAIQSEAQIREILATVWPYSKDEPSVTVYYVNGLGSQSYLREYTLTRKAQLRECHIGVFVHLDRHEDYSGFSLRDCNVPANTYNHHHLFADKELAEAYLEYAKVNTPNIGWSDFDD